MWPRECSRAEAGAVLPRISDFGQVSFEHLHPSQSLLMIVITLFLSELRPGVSPPPGEKASTQLPSTTPPSPTELVALGTISRFPASRFCALPAHLAEPSPTDKHAGRGTQCLLLSAG